ncbi:hypothetical protein J6590_101594, partial [Homalodisca vitripennis]
VLKKKVSAAEKQRRYREKRKGDLEREAAYKAKHKLRNNKRKKIGDMSEREKRRQRKYWRKLDNKRRQKKLAIEKLPPTPPDDDIFTPPSGNKARGRKMCNCQIPLKTYNYTGLENESNKPAETSTPGKPSTSKKRESFYKNVYSSSDEECESVQYMESDNEEINISDMINSTDPNYDTNLPILETQTSTNVRQGVLVLVKVLGGARKKTNYQYVAPVTNHMSVTANHECY